MGLLDKLNPFSISANEVADFLSEELIVKYRHCKTEKILNAHITNELYDYFGEQVTSEYNIGGFFGLKKDIDINNGKIGIELKLAKSVLKSSESQRRKF